MHNAQPRIISRIDIIHADGGGGGGGITGVSMSTQW